MKAPDVGVTLSAPLLVSRGSTRSVTLTVRNNGQETTAPGPVTLAVSGVLTVTDAGGGKVSRDRVTLQAPSLQRGASTTFVVQVRGSRSWGIGLLTAVVPPQDGERRLSDNVATRFVFVL